MALFGALAFLLVYALPWLLVQGALAYAAHRLGRELRSFREQRLRGVLVVALWWLVVAMGIKPVVFMMFPVGDAGRDVELASTTSNVVSPIVAAIAVAAWLVYRLRFSPPAAAGSATARG